MAAAMPVPFSPMTLAPIQILRLSAKQPTAPRRRLSAERLSSFSNAATTREFTIVWPIISRCKSYTSAIEPLFSQLFHKLSSLACPITHPTTYLPTDRPPLSPDAPHNTERNHISCSPPTRQEAHSLQPCPPPTTLLPPPPPPRTRPSRPCTRSRPSRPPAPRARG